MGVVQSEVERAGTGAVALSPSAAVGGPSDTDAGSPPNPLATEARIADLQRRVAALELDNKNAESVLAMCVEVVTRAVERGCICSLCDARLNEIAGRVAA